MLGCCETVIDTPIASAELRDRGEDRWVGIYLQMSAARLKRCKACILAISIEVIVTGVASLNKARLDQNKKIWGVIGWIVGLQVDC